ncbi:LacI family transcriptional regulator [Thermomicrobiaceae bacterium CFH 74404]|uniref:LacI family transcriptional regulator n=1 Tax=Thermalbibacter longus TaxID=2951981 RepID=A0AA42BAF3_9BACT|nr:LacI family DNA-binding transcriptional regulator [Thermalbibacter longus]MCM8748499.1 LacI family transcriptional regulator [Thermalbibacter longus]
MKGRHVTVRQVAREAGVSVATVSHYLNGRYSEMSAATRERVQATIERLGYRPNELARSLARRRTATIGLIISSLTNSLYPLVILGAEAACRRAEYSLLLADAPDVESERRAVDLMRRKQVDGLILFSISLIGIANEHLFRAQAEGTPVVVINRDLPAEAPISQIQFDNFRGAYLATKHLIELGHRRIAHITHPLNRFTAISRRAGYTAALAEAGLEHDPSLVVSGDYSFESGYEATRSLLERQPSAVFVGSDAMAAGALRALRDAGREAPHDLSLVAFGNPDYIRYSTPALTTVDLPIAEAGAIAVELLLERIGEPEAPAQTRVLQPKLLIRETTAPPQPRRKEVGEQP